MTSPSESLAEELSEKEALPPHTSEIGTLKKLPDHDTEWLGSSSGVFFVNTVRRAFSAAFSATTFETQSYPASEDILVGGEHIVSSPVERTLAQALGKLPPRSVASELVLSFFKAWHPLFPFLHGPTFLSDVEAIYVSNDRPQPQAEGQTKEHGPSTELDDIDIRKAVILLLIVNIASLDSAETTLPSSSRIKSSGDVARMAGILGVRHDIITIQALVASELYLIATRALREASTVGGMLLRNMFHAGLHRCPLRYAQLSPEDCEIRKRIFWSAYALDRHLSQSLGAPLTLQDSDIDTCLSGTRELHRPVTREMLAGVSSEIALHMPSKDPWAGSAQPERHSTDSNVASDIAEAEVKQRREAALRSYVQYGRLTGRVVEIFHKSVHARFPERDAILHLTSDVDAWWNDLPGFLSGEDVVDVPAHQRMLIPFFTILYQNLLILVNRPALSLPPTSAEFQHGLQVCIKASRTTLSALKLHQEQGLTMFWPGLLAANWMAGLIIAFACQMGKYPVTRACS
jgi:Fungal specific transcription factor domain